MDLNPRRILDRIGWKLDTTPPERLARISDWLSVGALLLWSATLLAKAVILSDNPTSPFLGVQAWPMLLAYVYFDLIGDDIRKYIDKQKNTRENDKAEEIGKE